MNIAMEFEYSAELVPDELVLFFVRLRSGGVTYFAQGSERVDDIERSNFALARERLQELKEQAWFGWARANPEIVMRALRAAAEKDDEPTRDDLALRTRMRQLEQPERSSPTMESLTMKASRT